MRRMRIGIELLAVTCCIVAHDSSCCEPLVM
jgi:hypothetical protein